MINRKEKPIETNIVKKVKSKLDLYKFYYGQLSLLGLDITKVQVAILATIACEYEKNLINLALKKEITAKVGTTLQVVENTLVKFRKKHIITKDNYLSERFKINLKNRHKLTVLFLLEA